MTHLVDCHVLTMPADNAEWAAALRRDLDGEPVNQHWLAGIPGQLGQARAAGFALGAAPFVSFADPDDRIIAGTFAALLAALEARPLAPFAWAGEQRVDEDLAPMGRPAIWPQGYDQRRHRNHPTYCQGVVLIRRAALAPVMHLLRQCGNGAEGVLLAHLAGVDVPQPAERQPVHVPIVGRLWRQHPAAYHRAYSAADRNRNKVLGVEPQYLHVVRARQAVCATCGPP